MVGRLSSFLAVANFAAAGRLSRAPRRGKASGCSVGDARLCGIGAALVLATLCAPAASAALITQTMNADLSLADSTTLQFNGFNPTLGTLTDVSADLSGTVNTSATITNNTDESQSVRAFAEGGVSRRIPNVTKYR
jgi:hypothetical protein